MITRAQIRRQLRKEGGIMNVVPRQGYFLGSIGRAIGKAVGKVGDVAKQVVKSPIGQAALIGGGLYGLNKFGIGPQSMGKGFFGKIGPALFGATTPNVRAPGMPSFLGETGFNRTGGLLGKLGLTKGGGSMMPTALGGITGASLLTYFMAKGKTEDEAEELAQDVYRGKGLGMDLIKSDMQKYRSGILSASQAHDKGYHFLTPRNYLGAQGGRVGLKKGSPHGKTDKEVLEELYPTLFSDTTTSIEGSPKKKKNYKKKADGGRIGKYGGGVTSAMPRIPTGMPRVNAGGISELDYRQEGGFVPMGVKEKADDVPAMLSKNEFVMTADAVKGAGGGNVEKGAQKMYNTMKQLEGRIA